MSLPYPYDDFTIRNHCDQELLHRARTAPLDAQRQACVDELSRRFPEFLVWLLEKREYVAEIDTYTSRFEFTRDPRQARIFRGPGWIAEWAQNRQAELSSLAVVVGREG